MLRIVALFIFYLPQLSTAQYSNPWNNIGIEEGLFNLSINDIEQDSLGFIWLATNEGIGRFDGEFIREFPKEDSLSIRHYSVVDILMDGNVIWLALKGKGLFKYNIETDESQQIKELADIDIYKLRLEDDKLWISTPRHGLIIYQIDKGQVQYYFNKRNNIIDALPFGKDSLLCSLVGGGLFHLSAKDSLNAFKTKYKPIERSADDGGLDYTCHNLHIVDGKILAGCWDNAIHTLEGSQLSSLLLPGEKELDFQGEEVKVSAVFKNKLIVGLKSGKLYWLDPETQEFRPIPKNGFEGEELKSIFVDQDSRIWIGTEQGVNFMSTAKPILEISPLVSEENSGIKVNALDILDSVIYVGTDNGLFVYENGLLLQKNKMLSGKRIYSLLPYENSLMIGTATTVYELNSITKEIKNLFDSPLILPGEHPFEPNDLKYSRYTALAVQPTRYGDLLFASAYGYTLIYYHLEEAWHSFSLLDGQIKETLYNDIAVDSDNNLFLAGEQDGLFAKVEMYFPTCNDEEFFEKLPLREKCTYEFAALASDFQFNSSTHTMFRSNSFRNIQIDDLGVIWTNTPGGLFRVGDSIRRLDLPYNEIKTFLTANENIWSVANNGLQLSNDSGQSLFFGEKEGVPKSGLSGPILIHNDEIFLGGNGFIAKAKLSSLIQNKKQSYPLFLSEIYTLKDKRFPRNENGVYTIDESDNGLSISVALVDFKAATNNKFDYKVSGLYDFWIENDNNNEILLPALKGGFYQVFVRALDHNGAQISEVVSYSIRVQMPYYKYWWFKISMILLGLGIVWYWFYSRQIERNRILKMREHISRDLHDDVGSLLGSISIYTAAANNALDQGKSEVTKSILNTIGDHSRSMIDNMSDIVWSINTDYDTLENLIVKMEIYAHKVLQAKGILTEFKVSSNMKSREIGMEKRKNLYLIFKECIHNILKHSGATEVKIIIKEEGDKLFFSICDNGKGFDVSKNDNGIGNGLKSMEARAKEINASLNIVGGIESGCKIEVKM